MDSEPLRYPFRVHPAWWSSWWAWTLLGAAFTLAFRAYYSRRTQILQRQNQLLEELVAERTAEAEEASRAKSAFLANMSHELRTPLNSIIGFSDILVSKLEGQTEPRYVRFLHNIQSSGQHLLTLINDILDLSKIEAGRMELYLEQMAVPPVIDNMLATLQPVAFPRGVDLQVELSPDLPEVVLDGAKLRQILINLVSNAIKFSPDQGTVWTAVRALDAGDSPLGRATLLVEVRDQGIGIDPRDQERVFEEFQQVESGAARHYGGTGLGLALVRRFVEQLGGTIRLESALGKGSTFRVYLPIDASSHPRERPGGRR